MSSGYFRFGLALLAITGSVSAQTLERRATMNGKSGDAKCTIEVVVDGTAEVEIRGEIATLRNLKGNPPQWRRFECNAVLPPNPAGFRFQGIDGRGRQQLMQDPRNGAPAVIRIDDPASGQEGYTFDIMWGQSGPISREAPPIPRPYPMAPPPPPPPGPPARRFFTDDAVQACQSYVRDQAARRFRAGDVIFRRTRMDDQPGRNDWVTGFFEARSPVGPPRTFQFSCSVDFDNGRVRTADIRPVNNPMGGWGDAASGRAIQACEVSVEQRLTRDGYRRVDFGSVNVDDRPGRNDWIVGAASALERNGPIWFDFSCSVDLREGTVRSADVNRR